MSRKNRLKRKFIRLNKKLRYTATGHVFFDARKAKVEEVLSRLHREGGG